MADQKLVAIQHVLFLLEQIFYLTNLQLLDRVSSLMHFDYLCSQA